MGRLSADVISANEIHVHIHSHLNSVPIGYRTDLDIERQGMEIYGHENNQTVRKGCLDAHISIDHLKHRRDDRVHLMIFIQNHRPRNTMSQNLITSQAILEPGMQYPQEGGLQSTISMDK